ncbi:NERD domain-containing protein [Cytobacillus spongiae]|uniref:nuclease-related domain-containing protein n=1 Tax=Cytobacillus spongiae TaxID=2901381 RepID=UPI001F324DEB|nr:nuclease-related domain-containing protein [Cytobacillus spongiae]UII55545.1 NERD domain-containing protein [Cytobacillus spongiae]
MIIKHRSIPLRILKHEALLRRISNNHPKRIEIERNLTKNLAGYKGEKTIDYHLEHLKDFMILHDVRLSINNLTFQIDTLLLSSKFLLLLEIKNIFGTLIFDHEFKQLIRKNKEDKEEGFPTPLAQANRHSILLKKWLDTHTKFNLPIEYFIVISHSSTILKTSTNSIQLFDKVFHAQHLIEKINTMQKKYRTEHLDEKSLKKLSKLIIKAHSLEDFNILSYYKMEESEVIPGVACPNCKQIGMVRLHGCWKCPSCTHLSKDAHLSTISDYFLLIDDRLTNHKFCEFSLLASPNIASRILTTHLPHSGSN